MNITYLLGAGASANSLPVVNNMRYRIGEVAKFINIYCKTANNELFFSGLPREIQDNNKILQNIHEDLQWLLEQSENHQTIDTLARKYYLTALSNIKKNKDLSYKDNPPYLELLRLKRSLILYFTVEQLYNIGAPLKESQKNDDFVRKEYIDKRYDSFIASIAQPSSGGIILKENIKILSWNYDVQFELALKGYMNESMETLQAVFQITPNSNTYNYVHNDVTINKNEFCMIKLNGNALWYPSSEKNYTPIFDKHQIDNKSHTVKEYEENTSKFLIDLITDYEQLFSNSNYLNDMCLRYFNFSWENNEEYKFKYNGYNSNIANAKAIAAQTETLIVIGYSFPYFNNDMDAMLFNEMKNLKEIIVQDFDAVNIIERMKLAFPSTTTNAPLVVKGQLIHRPAVKFTALQPSQYFFVHPLT